LKNPLDFLSNKARLFFNTSGKEIEFFYSFYLAFIILHIAILASSLAFLLTALRKMLATTHSRSMRYLITATLISLIYLNDVAKAFFWTPHTQLFNIFVVPFSLYSWILLREKLTLRKEVVWFISVSLLLFFYPLLVVVLTIPLLTQYKRYWTWVICALLPYLVYPKLLTVFGGVYKNTATTKYDQFVWLFDVKSLNQLGERLTALLGTFDSQHVVITLCCMSLLIVDFRSFLMKKELLIYAGFLGGYFLFIFGMGAYFYRITTLFWLQSSLS
jgi:hypothetical protein